MVVQLARENPTPIALLVSPGGQRGPWICGHCAQGMASLAPFSIRSGVDAGSASACGEYQGDLVQISVLKHGHAVVGEGRLSELREAQFALMVESASIQHAASAKMPT